MIIALALAFQGPPTTPLPAQMEPAVDSYARCLSAQTDQRLATHIQTPSAGPKIFEVARSACAEVRAGAVAAADAALASLIEFSDSDRRRVFVAERFEGLDQLMREAFSGGLDPDKWDQ